MQRRKAGGVAGHSLRVRGPEHCLCGSGPRGAAKKLIEAVQVALDDGSSEVDRHETVDDLTAFGAPADVIERATARAKGKSTFQLWRRNLPVWRLWVAVQGQWRFSEGMPTGLDFTAVKAMSEAMGITMNQRISEDIRTLEAVAGDIQRKQIRRKMEQAARQRQRVQDGR
ncbi:MAG: DUF1799 domain-containing protein [Rhodospirillaceae bacterium]